ncbi:MAG TPA: thioredoxin family protein [Egibacteraceae bacterium]|nr:thioredoxin family protein [Egibacteraceae bacterium]
MRPDLVVLAAVVALTALAALWWRARDGRVRPAHRSFTQAELEAVAAPPGAWTLLEVVVPRCGPCAAARQVLDEVAARRGDVAVRAIGVDEHIELVRAHRVLRAPTVFVIDPAGAVRARAAGVPDPGELGRVLDRSYVGGP